MNDLQEFIAYAAAHGQLNVASVATGSSQHLMGELFSEKLINSGMEPFHTSPEKMAAQMKADHAETTKIIKTANIKMEE